LTNSAYLIIGQPGSHLKIFDAYFTIRLFPIQSNDGVFEAINIRFDDELTYSFLVEEPMSVDTCLIVDDSE
jgi:hypothetical protein